MDKKYIPYIFIALLCIGLFMLGKGITGGVVSQSCCYGESCHPDYVCDVFDQNIKENESLISVGTIVVLSSALLFVMLHNRSNYV